MADMWSDTKVALSDPASNAAIITAGDDESELPFVTRGIAALGGDVSVVTVDDSELVIPEGLFDLLGLIPLRVKQVKAMDTTATTILLLW